MIPFFPETQLPNFFVENEVCDVKGMLLLKTEINWIKSVTCKYNKPFK